MIDHKTLYEKLCTLGIPVAYDHFDSNKQVAIPFVVYREISTDTFKVGFIPFSVSAKT